MQATLSFGHPGGAHCSLQHLRQHGQWWIGEGMMAYSSGTQAARLWEVTEAQVAAATSPGGFKP